MARHSDFTTARMAAIALCLAGIWSIPAFAQETDTTGNDSPPAVEVDLGVLDSLQPAFGYPSLEEEPEATPETGSVLVVEPADADVSDVSLPPLPDSQPEDAPLPPLPDVQPDIVAQPASSTPIPPIPQPAPEQKIALASDVDEAVVTEDVVTEDVVTEDGVIEDAVIDEAPEIPAADVVETVETTEATEIATLDATADDGDETFQEIETMLTEAQETPEIVVLEPETTVEETVVATATQTVDEAGPEETLQILFDPGDEILTDNDRSNLLALASDLAADEGQRIQLRAYASAQGGTSSMARRLALSRALEVRKFLIDNGVRSTRIDVRALGDSAEAAPLDRIDIVLVER